MRSRPRARLSVDERRTQLLDLGRRLFNARPYDAISIDEIAAAAGISKGLLYHYFPSKRHFYVEVVRVGAEHVQRVTAVRPELAPAEQLPQSIDSFLTYVEKNAPAYGHLLRSGVGTDPEASAIVEDTRRGDGRPGAAAASASPTAAPPCASSSAAGSASPKASRSNGPSAATSRAARCCACWSPPSKTPSPLAATADPRTAPMLEQVLSALRTPHAPKRPSTPRRSRPSRRKASAS